MIGMEKIELITNLTIASGYLQGERPLNLMLLAMGGSGKSDLLEGYASSPGVLYTAYTSFAQLLKRHGDKIVSGDVRHIIVPDFAVSVGRSKDISSGELAALGVLIEEGIIRYETTRITFQAATGRRVGMIIGLTNRTLLELRQIAPPGFIGRFLRVSYSFSPETKQHVLESIANQAYRHNTRHSTMRLSQKVIKGDAEIFKRLSQQVSRIKDDGDAWGFRTQKHLQTIMLANALCNGRSQVDTTDLETLAQLAPYLNEEYRPI